MIKLKKWISSILVLSLCTSILVGCTADKTNSGKDENEKKEEIAVETSQVNSLMSQIDEELQKQLAPMPEEGKKEKVGVLIISLTNQFWANMKKCYEEAAEKLDIEIDVVAAPTEGDTASQLEALDAMIAKDYDAIIVSPIEGTNLIPGVVRANQKGTPIINLGPGFNKEALEAADGVLDAKITVDFQEQGKMVAKDMVDRIKAGEVAIIQGLPGAGQSEGRTNGAKEYFEGSKDIELVNVQPADWDRNKAYEITKNLIQSNPELKGIFACNDVMALGAIEALEDAGKKDVLVYGVDFTNDAKEAIKAGKMMGSITYSSAAYTKAGLLLAMKVAQGQEIDKPIYSPLTLVNQDNINEFENWK